MYNGSFGIKKYSKNSSNPFIIQKNTTVQGNIPPTIHINKSFLPQVFSLSRTGIRLLLYFIGTNSCESGILYFNLKECKKVTGFCDKRSIYNGLIELLGENIIARTEDENIYYLNLEIIRTSG